MIKPMDAVIFASGFIIGAIGSYFFTKSRLDKKYETRLSNMRDVYEIMQKPKKTEVVYSVETAKTEDKEQYIEMVKESGYDTPVPKKKTPDHYVISPEEYGECGYEKISLVYTSDGFLVDSDDLQKVENIDDLIGDDFTAHFGEYEDDSVHIRNDVRKCDYEIVYSMKSYDELRNRRPPVVWRQNE